MVVAGVFGSPFIFSHIHFNEIGFNLESLLTTLFFLKYTNYLLLVKVTIFHLEQHNVEGKMNKKYENINQWNILNFPHNKHISTEYLLFDHMFSINNYGIK